MSPETIGSFAAFRNHLIDKLLLIAAIVATPGVAISLWRIPVIGWRPVMALHVAVLFLLWGLWLRRASIAYCWRAGMFLAMIGLVGLAALWQFGLMGGGRNFVLLFCIFTILLFPQRLGWGAMAAYLALFTLVSFLASQGWFAPPIDYNQALRDPRMWIEPIWSTVVYGMVLAYTVWYMVSGLIEREAAARSLLEQRQRAEEAGVRQADLTRSVMDSIDSSIAVLDANGAILHVNRSWKDFALANAGNAATHTGIGLNYFAICRQAADQGNEWAGQALDGMQRVATGETAAFQMEYPCDAPSEPRWFLLQVTPLAGQLKGLVVNHINVTGRKQAEQEMLLAKAVAEDASQAKSAFLSSMSHELRTPLNAVISMAQMLDLGLIGPLAPKQKVSVGHILDGGRHLLELVNDALDLVRIESGKLNYSIETLVLGPVIEESLTITQTLAARRRIEISSDSCQNIHIHADRSRVMQVLLNLLSNAVKYNREGGMLSLSCKLRDDFVRIVVTDTGPGIAEENQAQVFQPFQRFGAERSTIEGTGIGLAICKRLIEDMGGAIGFSSMAGVGSVFWFELPRVQGAVPESVPATAADGVTDRPDDALRGRVLYVEDNPLNVMVMEHLFLRFPAVELMTAENGERALALVREVLPDLVLMDINLPGMSGIDVLRVMRSDPRLANIPAIAISASAMWRDIDLGLAAGFLDYHTKPVDVAALSAQIRSILRGNEVNEDTEKGERP